MGSKTYAFEPNGPTRLEISWDKGYKTLVIYMDGKRVGAVPTKKELESGQEFDLFDGSTLHVRLVTTALSEEGLEVLRNGRPVPGSFTSPAMQAKNSAGALYFVALFFIILGLQVIRAEPGDALAGSLGNGYWIMAYGAIYVILGVCMQRGALWAARLAILLLAPVALLVLAQVQKTGITLQNAGILLGLILLLAFMLRGEGALRKLKQAEQSAAADPAYGSEHEKLPLPSPMTAPGDFAAGNPTASPVTKWDISYASVYVLAAGAVFVLLGLFNLLFNPQATAQVGTIPLPDVRLVDGKYAYGMLAYGVLYLVLTLAVRRHSLAALWAAIVLFIPVALLCLGALITTWLQHGAFTRYLLPLLVSLWLLLGMVYGLPALNAKSKFLRIFLYTINRGVGTLLIIAFFILGVLGGYWYWTQYGSKGVSLETLLQPAASGSGNPLGGLFEPRSTPTASAPDPARCKLWSEISAEHLGQQICVYGEVKEAYAGGELFYLTFSSDRNDFRLVATNGKDFSSTKGQCVMAQGQVKAYGKMPYIEVSDRQPSDLITHCP